MEKLTNAAERISNATKHGSTDVDNAVKYVLASKPILAHILKGCLKEYENISLEDIEKKYIEGNPSVANEPVHEDDYMPNITGVNIEHTTLQEGKSTFDVKFNALAPDDNNYMHLIVNVEGQKSDKYSLIKRGIYYCGRMLSAQYGRNFKSPNYNKVCKVVSIWICFDSSAVKKNTINRYTLQEETISGQYKLHPKEYNLIDVVLIYLDKDETPNSLLNLLDTIFMRTYNSIDEKLIALENSGLQVTEEVEKRVVDMCNYSEFIEERAAEEKTVEFVEKMLKNNEPLSKILAYTDLTEQRIFEIAARIGVVIS